MCSDHNSEAEPAAKIFEGWIKQLNDLNWAVRAEVFDTLLQEKERAVPYLAAALGRACYSVQSRIIRCLTAMGPKSKPAMWALLNLLRQDNGLIFEQALEALVAIGPDGLSILRYRFKHASHPYERAGIIRVIGCLKITDPVVIDLVIDALNDNELVYKSATSALIKIGAVTIPPLLKHIKQDTDSEFYDKVLVVLLKIQPYSSVVLPVAIAALAHPERDIRRLARQALVHMGRGNAAAVTALLAATRDRNFVVASGALAALSELGVAAHSAVSQLLDLLLKGCLAPSVIKQALLTLRKIEQAHQELSTTDNHFLFPYGLNPSPIIQQQTVIKETRLISQLCSLCGCQASERGSK